jgi:cell wall assembly regulator SMI1
MKIIQGIRNGLAERSETNRVKRVQKEFERVLPNDKLSELYIKEGDKEANKVVYALFDLLDEQSLKKKRFPWEIL